VQIAGWLPRTAQRYGGCTTRSARPREIVVHPRLEAQRRQHRRDAVGEREYAHIASVRAERRRELLGVGGAAEFIEINPAYYRPMAA
jgi:hypothetical protein